MGCLGDKAEVYVLSFIELPRINGILLTMRLIRLKLSKMNWRVVLVLSAVLSCAQVSAIEHEAEHFSHSNQELCQSFIAYDLSAEPFSEVTVAFNPIVKQQPISLLSNLPNLFTVQSALIRAPPRIIQS